MNQNKANTQIWDSQCMARANSGYLTTQRGVQSYLNLGIDPSQLILGMTHLSVLCSGS